MEFIKCIKGRSVGKYRIRIRKNVGNSSKPKQSIVQERSTSVGKRYNRKCTKNTKHIFHIRLRRKTTS